VDRPVELIPLICLRCSMPVPAEPDQVAWVCTQCGQGMSLDYAKGLRPLQVYYTAGITPGSMGKPYWVADGQVEIKRRESYGSAGQALQDAQRLWSKPQRFFLPAYASTLEALLVRASALLIQPPALQAGPSAPFEAVTLASEDIQQGAEFIVMAIEAGRKDKLKSVDFSLKLGEAALWILAS
jgi:hypothetical protein